MGEVVLRGRLKTSVKASCVVPGSVVAHILGLAVACNVVIASCLVVGVNRDEMAALRYAVNAYGEGDGWSRGCGRVTAAP